MSDVSDFPVIHNQSKHPLYHIYYGIKDRCYNTKTPAYPRYGGRGIFMCDRWRNSFHAFVYDMGIRPSPEHSIERVDNDLGYCPENCVWATRQQQSRNRSNNVVLSQDGKTMCLAEWAQELGMSQKLLYCRNQRKMDHTKIFYRGKIVKRGWKIDGVLVPYHDLEKKYGVCRHAIRDRHRRGWSFEKAVTNPVRSASEGWEINGRFYSCSELSKKWKIKKGTLLWRFRKGWSAEKASQPTIEKYRNKNATNS